MAAIILGNTRHLGRTAAATLRGVEEVPDHLLVHLSPLGREHVDPTGDHIRAPADEVPETRDGSRPLRAVPGDLRLDA